MESLAAWLPALMFVALAAALLSGVPVVLGLAGCGLAFAALGIAIDAMPAALLQALPLRLFAIMNSELLLAIPFFTLMGLVLDRSGLAADLLETAAEVFGPVRGGLAFAVVLVGALLAATTGVVAASVISMGLISLPLMLRHGYDPRLASGVIAAAGSLTQIVPPSLVLIVLAEQVGRSVGEMYAAALVPAAMVIVGYLLVVAVVAWRWPQRVPALAAAGAAGDTGASSGGRRSLAVLMLLSAAAGAAFTLAYPALVVQLGRTVLAPPPDELLVVALGATGAFAFALAWGHRLLRLSLLSPLACRVAFVLAPPLLLIFLVLGTIYLGVATPTEAGALGALGAVAIAAARGRLTIARLADAALASTKLSCFVIFILVGSTVFAHTFNALDGTQWVAGLFERLPGGATGMLVVVTALVFVLGFFLDFFEIAFILVPLLAPVAAALGIDLVWFAVLLAVNLQTSFLTPPFGYALFFLRGVAPARETVHAASGTRIPPVATMDIYRGALPFVAVQLVVMGLLIAFPGLVQLERWRGTPLPPAAVEEMLRRGAPVREPPVPPAWPQPPAPVSRP